MSSTGRETRKQLPNLQESYVTENASYELRRLLRKSIRYGHINAATFSLLFQKCKVNSLHTESLTEHTTYYAQICKGQACLQYE